MLVFDFGVVALTQRSTIVNNRFRVSHSVYNSRPHWRRLCLVYNSCGLTPSRTGGRGHISICKYLCPSQTRLNIFYQSVHPYSSVTNVLNTILSEWPTFAGNWHKWSRRQWHETINFGVRIEVKNQGHGRPKLDLEPWRRHHSWPPWVK